MTETHIYCVYKSNAPVEPHEPEWIFVVRCSKWGLRPVIRELRKYYDRVSILIERED